MLYILSTNNFSEAIELYSSRDKGDDELLEDAEALFFVGEDQNEMYVAFKGNPTLAYIIHEVTHMVEHMLKHNGVDDSETLAYSIGFWSEIVIRTIYPSTPLTTEWIGELVKVSSTTLD